MKIHFGYFALQTRTKRYVLFSDSGSCYNKAAAEKMGKFRLYGGVRIKISDFLPGMPGHAIGGESFYAADPQR